MKCGPDDCPIVAFSDLTPAEQRVERARIAKKMIEQGFTEQQIAKQLGVSQATISGDLNLSTVDKLKPAKSASNPKGAGRPKGKRTAPKPHYRETEIVALADKNMSATEIAAQTGVGKRQVRHVVEREQIRREARAEPEITRADLSLTGQQKLDKALQRHQRELDLIFEGRVQQEINERLDHIILPVWRKKIAEAKKIYDARRSITNKETFNLIVRCLHTDTRKHLSDEVVNDAFVRFMALEKYLLNEKDSPTKFAGLPTTAAEWEQRKQEAATLRRAKRGHANVSRSQ